METRKKLNIGNSDFKSIVENNNYLIDKSLLIRDFIKIQKQVILLPRPRRFGKTLNLSMLKCFFDINHQENAKLFADLKIWQTEQEIKDKCCKYPVIYLSFKDAKANNWGECLELIVAEIASLYESHKYLIDSHCLSQAEIKTYESIVNRNAKLVDYQRSIKQLSEFLFKYHKEKSVILIDEYDTPIQAGYKKFYEESISFMRNLLSGAFKDNDYLYKGVITGILRVSRESIFTGLNNVSVYSILDDEFSDKFGFTESETKQILKDFDVPTDYEQIKTWYNGYKFGETQNIYNPWSILNYAVGYKSGFKPYWVNTSSDSLLRERIAERDANYTREQLLKLINNESIEKNVEENFVFPDMDTDKELLWTLLVFSGYLTTVSKRDIDVYNIKIPNYEIKYVFKSIILKWLSVEVKIKKTLLEETTKHLINNELQKFERGFKQIIGDTFSYFDLNGEAENVYQSYVLGLLAIIGDDYIIKSNRESGEGRYDIMLIPHDKSKFGVVIEIKQIPKIEKENETEFAERVNKKLSQALNQINENEYYKELIDNKIEKIIKLPIVFVGKVPYVNPIVKKQ